MEIVLPDFCLVVLIGPSGSGKTTFARRHFKPTEILSSDEFRALVSDDENNQMATRDAFEVLHLVLEKRLAAGHLTVVDATNLQTQARQPLLALARHHNCQPYAIVFDLPEEICMQNNRARPERSLTPEAIHRHAEQLMRALPQIEGEFRGVCAFHSLADVDTARVLRRRMPNNRRDERGPFDIIGDLHGCCTELETLLARLGYEYSSTARPIPGIYPRTYLHPEGRKAIFLGDLVDRGPRILETYQLARNMLRAGNAFYVVGNHEDKLLRKLRGHNVQISHGLETTLQELAALPEDARSIFQEEMEQFLANLPSHLVLDHGNLVVAHAGIKKSMIGRESAQVRAFVLYGEMTGEIDEFGLPVRAVWANRYHGRAFIVYGHTAVRRPEWVNNTINIDTGCVYGGRLTAFRYPERELVAVPSERAYAPPKRPLQGSAEPSSPEGDSEIAPEPIPDRE
jgi:protein phosphatase